MKSSMSVLHFDLNGTLALYASGRAYKPPIDIFSSHLVKLSDNHDDSRSTTKCRLGKLADTSMICCRNTIYRFYPSTLTRRYFSAPLQIGKKANFRKK